MARRSRSALPKHVSPAWDRHGKLRYRFRKGMHSAYIKAEFPSDEFDRQYQAALKGETIAKTQVGKRREIARSFQKVIGGARRRATASRDFFKRFEIDIYFQDLC